MNLLLYMAPIAVVLLLPATLIMEKNVVGITIALARDDFRIVWYLLFNSALAYLVNLTNFLVTNHTSALTLQVITVHIPFTFLVASLFMVEKMIRVLVGVERKLVQGSVELVRNDYLLGPPVSEILSFVLDVELGLLFLCV